MRNRKIALLLVLLLVMLDACDRDSNFPAQDYFLKYFGADGNQTGVDMATAADGTIYLLGNTASSNSLDRQLYIIRSTPQGNIEWETSFGGPFDEDARDIEIMLDGNLAILANVTDLSTGERDFTILLLNSADGSVINSTTDGFTGYDDDANSITEIADGFLVSGSTNNIFFPSTTDQRDAFVFRYYADLRNYANNPNSWVVHHGNSDYDVATKTMAISPTLFYVFGSTRKDDGDQIPDDNAWIFPISSTGGESNNALVSNTLITGAKSRDNNERLTSVVAVTTDTGTEFLITGYTSNAVSGLQEVFVAKTRENIQSIPIPDANNPPIFSVNPIVVTDRLGPISNARALLFPSATDGYLLLANANTTGNDEWYLKRLDAGFGDGWKSEPHFFLFGGEGNDLPGAVSEASDGRILIFGTMILGNSTGQGKMTLIKLSPNGKFGE